MYACLSHLFFYNDICCSMYLIKIMVVMMMMIFVGLRPKTIGTLHKSDCYIISKHPNWNLDLMILELPEIQYVVS
jgi:hypothetical protein